MLGRNFPNLKFILPTAREISLTVNSGYPCNGWFDIKQPINFIDFEKGAKALDDEPGLMKSVDSLETLIEREIENGDIPPESIVIGGFSQGSVISLLTGLSSKKKLGGIMALSGWLPLSHKIAEWASPHAKDMAIFWGHGKDDNVVKYDCESNHRFLTVQTLMDHP